MLTVDEALRAVLERVGPLPPRSRPPVEALGCVLAEDVTADLDLPPFDKALVDGFAVRAADLHGDDPWLTIGEEITAGRTPTRPLGPREAAAIMTGAPLPPGADAVVMIEQTQCREGGVLVEVETVRSGQNRLVRGREMRAGEIVLRRGVRLNAARLGLLASVGRTEVTVVPRPRVAIVPTGDELVEPDQVPGPGQIRNSNAVMLQALATGVQRRRRGAADRPRRSGASGRGARARAGRRRALDHRRGLGRQARPCPRRCSSGWACRASSTRSGSSPASPSGSASARAGRGPPAPRLRPARQPGQRPRRLPPLRPTRPRGPRGAARVSDSRSPHIAWSSRFPRRATAPPTTPRPDRDRRRPGHRAARLGRIGRPPHRRPSRRIRHLSGRRPHLRRG